MLQNIRREVICDLDMPFLRPAVVFVEGRFSMLSEQASILGAPSVRFNYSCESEQSDRAAQSPQELRNCA
jgi:hypothetical protein